MKKGQAKPLAKKAAIVLKGGLLSTSTKGRNRVKVLTQTRGFQDLVTDITGTPTASFTTWATRGLRRKKSKGTLRKQLRRYRQLPFAKKLSAKSPAFARVLAESYAEGIATASRRGHS